VVTAWIQEEGDLLRIEVADSGTGIAPEVLSRLFTPFATKNKNTGTGLGLAMAQKAVVSHDGAITARNASDGGACFTITLPCRRETSRQD
jgi:signal transduction histidine kinase